MAINTERLERVAELLDGYVADPAPPVSFDLGVWHVTEVKKTGYLWWKREIVCHTAACAIGLVCMSGIFAGDGFRPRVGIDQKLYPTFGRLRHWQAILAFFSLSERQALHLFGTDAYEINTGKVAADAVAARIRDMIARSQRARRSRLKTSAMVAQIKARALQPEPV